MILTEKEITKRMNNGDIQISPFDKKQMNPNSYNLKLHDELLIYQEEILDMAKENKTQKIKIPKEGFELKPGRLYLGRTHEYTITKNLVPKIEGRSSIGRLGVFVHITAGFGDVGYSGHWTLEILCVQPVKIYPFSKICQISYYEILGKDCKTYDGGKYQNSKDIHPSYIYKEFKQTQKTGHN